ncbi:MULTISPECIES: hypothetical protein [unclassified Pseudoalteromonas]|uniref:hypothetical protein n=1 Tax=unclassified Pseudoalteromonas TaxID=194690 RepID=UPI002096C420|nr:hypothetical protein [Pseudoalteromonas sp. XMcav2-N]MCO7190233.1 hypothetical protein [Pseudoalteromonas sp. XMcav2-N]
MSTDNITELLTQVAVRANALCQSVEDHAGNINATVNAKKAEMDAAKQQAHQDIQNYIAGARGEQSHILLSRNQQMEPLGSGAIKGFNTIGLETFEVTREASIYGSAGDHDTDHTGNGVGASFRSHVYSGYVNKKFNILRIKWKTSPGKTVRLDNTYYNGYEQGALTKGCYIKVIEGQINGDLHPVTNFDDGWQLYAYRQAANSPNGAFYTPHTGLSLSSSTGEALICLYGSVSGYVNLENNVWGCYPEFVRPSDIAGLAGSIESLSSRVNDLETPTA